MKLNYLFKVTLTLIILVILFQKIKLDEVINIIFSANKIFLAMSMIFVLILYLIRTYRWEILLNSIGVQRPFVDLFKMLMIGTFYGLFTPGKVGELGRTYHLAEKKSATISTILVEKLIDIIVLIVASIFTVIIFFYDYNIFKYFILACAICTLFFSLAMTNKRFISLWAKPLKIKEDDVSLYIDSVLMLLKDKQTIFKTTLLAIVYYLVAYIFAYFLLRSLNIDPRGIITLPIIILMGNVPVTISGVGLRESVGAASFVILGMSSAEGISFSMLLFLSMILLPGIFGYLMVITMPGYVRYKGQITGILSPFLEGKRLNKIRTHILGSRILDFGCGYGKLASSFNDMEYVGVDIDKMIIDAAKDQNTNNNVRFYCLDDFRRTVDVKFDSIVLAAVIEHLDDPATTLMELKGYLREGGRIILTTPSPKANQILLIGSKLGLFSRKGVDEHKSLLTKKDFLDISIRVRITLEKYEMFELGLNQLVIYTKNDYIG